MKVGTIGLVLVLALIGGPSVVHSSERVVSKSYTSGSSPGPGWIGGIAFCAHESAEGVGAVCMGQVGEGHVRIRIQDVLRPRVGGVASLRSFWGGPFPEYAFCGESDPIPLISGTYLVVVLDSAEESMCPAEELGFATRGKVHATFS